MTTQEEYDEIYAKYLAANQAIAAWTRHSTRLFNEAVKIAASDKGVKCGKDILCLVEVERDLIQARAELRMKKFLTFCQTGKYPE